jgi:hypothetical protein
LTWLGEGFDHVIRALVTQKTYGPLSMDFGFLAFPSDFVAPFSNGEEVRSMMDLSEDTEMCRVLISAMTNIEPIWCGSETGTPWNSASIEVLLKSGATVLRLSIEVTSSRQSILLDLGTPLMGNLSPDDALPPVEGFDARIADHKITRIDDLLPWRYAASAA